MKCLNCGNIHTGDCSVFSGYYAVVADATDTSRTFTREQMLNMALDTYKVRESILVKALKSIAAPQYGLDLNDTVEYQAEYWSKRAIEMMREARRALEAVLPNESET